MVSEFKFDQFIHCSVPTPRIFVCFGISSDFPRRSDHDAPRSQSVKQSDRTGLLSAATSRVITSFENSGYGFWTCSLTSNYS